MAGKYIYTGECEKEAASKLCIGDKYDLTIEPMMSVQSNSMLYSIKTETSDGVVTVASESHDQFKKDWKTFASYYTDETASVCIRMDDGTETTYRILLDCVTAFLIDCSKKKVSPIAVADMEREVLVYIFLDTSRIVWVKTDIDDRFLDVMENWKR